jgi:hypothetical protein
MPLQKNIGKLQKPQKPQNVKANEKRCLSASLPAFLSACLPACLHASLPACLPAFLPAWLHAYPPACMRADDLVYVDVDGMGLSWGTDFHARK